MRRQDRREQVMKIARQLVSQGGAASLTMTALSEIASVAKPVIYSHFSNSEDVIVALLDEHFEQLTTAVKSRVAGAGTVEQYISWMVDASFDFENTSDLPVQKVTNGFSANERVNEAFLRHEDSFRKDWERLLKQCGVHKDVVEVAAFGLSSMISNSVYSYALKPQQKRAREILKTMLLATIEAFAPDARKAAPMLVMPKEKAGQSRKEEQIDAPRRKESKPGRAVKRKPPAASDPASSAKPVGATRKAARKGA